MKSHLTGLSYLAGCGRVIVNRDDTKTFTHETDGRTNLNVGVPTIAKDIRKDEQDNAVNENEDGFSDLFIKLLKLRQP
mgnify:CR=1 FL=1